MPAAMERYVDSRYLEAAPSWHAEDSPWKAAQIMRVLDLKQSRRPLRICDVGCGAGGVIGALAQHLADRNIDAVFTGFDIAPLAIEWARTAWRHLANVRFECRDVVATTRLEHDTCLLIDVLEHLENPRGFLIALQQRGLSEFVIHLPLENNWLDRVRGKNDSQTDPFGHLHFYNTRGALDLCEQSGLHVVRWEYTPVFDVDLRFHRTLRSMLAYVPRKLLFSLHPRCAVETLGGAAMIMLCRRCHAKS